MPGQIARVVILFVAALAPAALRAQAMQDYVIPGPNAWSTAKTFGYTFQPIAGSGQTVTSPRDGVDTKLQTTQQTPLGTQTITLAQVVGGNASVNRPSSGSQTVTFSFFGNRMLSPGWAVKKVTLTGNYVWDAQPVAGSRDLSFRVRATSSTSTTGSAVISSITLEGPPGAQWSDAFATRKLFTITGAIAWAAAKGNGFTFQPLLTGITKRNPAVSGAVDGVATKLTHTRTDGFVCATPFETSALGTYYRCVLAEVVGGNMLVYAPEHSPYDIWMPQHTVQFEMFAGMRLAPGWILQRLDVSGGTWVQRPVTGSDDMSFILSLTSGAKTGANAQVTTIVLEGPASASTYAPAFSGAIPTP